jgi:hypothetical protein
LWPPGHLDPEIPPKPVRIRLFLSELMESNGDSLGLSQVSAKMSSLRLVRATQLGLYARNFSLLLDDGGVDLSKVHGAALSSE